MRRRRGARALPAALALAVALVAVLPGVAAARQDVPEAGAGGVPAGEASSARLVVAEMSGLLGPGSTAPAASGPSEGGQPSASGGGPGTPGTRPSPPSDLRLQLLVENDGAAELGDLRVVAEVYEPAGTRSTLRAALDEQNPAGARIHLRDVTVRDGGPLRPGGVAGLSVTIDGDEAGWTDRGGGVYPVSLAVVRGRRVLDRVMTAVVYLEEQPAGPLLTTVVWPLTGEPWRGARGAYRAGADRAIRPGGRLDVLLAAVEDNTTPAVQLAPSAHLLQDLAARADGFSRRTGDGDARRVGRQSAAAGRAGSYLERLRTAVGELPLPPLASPYGEVHLASMAERSGTLSAMAGRAVAEGRRRVARLAGRPPDAAAALPWVGMTPAAVDLLSAPHVLLEYDDIVTPDAEDDPTTDVPPALRTVRSGSGRAVTATVADPFVADTIGTPRDQHGVAAAVQRTLAETAMMYFEAPATAGRPLLILPPPDWDPGRRFATELLAGLTDARWLQLGRAVKQTVAADRRPPGARLATPADPLPAALARRIERLQSRLRAAGAAVPGTAPVGNRPRTELADQLLRTPSRWFLDGTAREARRMAGGVATAIDEAVGEVSVPDAATVTLTSEEGEIPVTVERTTGGPVRVRVAVRSTAGLRWPDGRETGAFTLQPGASETVSFPVRAVSRGRLPVTVRVTDPTGTIQLTRARVTVRSTAILSSGGLVIVGGVVVLLLVIAAIRRWRSSSTDADDRERRLEVVE